MRFHDKCRTVINVRRALQLVCVFVSPFPHLSAFVCVFFSLSAIFLGLDVYLLFCWAHFAHDYLCKNTSMWFLPSAASQSTLLSFSSSSQNSSIWSFIVFDFRDREKCYMPCYINVCVCVLFLACASVPGSFVWINYASTSVRMYKFGLFCLKKKMGCSYWTCECCRNQKVGYFFHNFRWQSNSHFLSVSVMIFFSLDFHIVFSNNNMWYV